MSSREKQGEREVRGASRREFLKTAATGVAAAAGAPGAAQAFDIESFLQKNFRQMSDEEIDGVVERLSRKYTQQYGKEVTVNAIGPLDDVVYGYGLDISRCIGCRRCVYACVDENNQSRDPQVHWIRVLEFEREVAVRGIDLEDGNPYYDHETVPAEDKFYLPMSCMHCIGR